jgi:hypothetical protein
MPQMIPFVPQAIRRAERARENDSAAAVHIGGISVLFTTADAAIEAVRVASPLSRAMGAPLTLVHFRAVPYPLALDAPVGTSPVETQEFMTRVRSEGGGDMRVRVYLCRREGEALASAFKHRSLIVMAGRHSWWPTTSERLRRRLEAAGHVVIFVEALDNREPFRA